MHQAHAYLSTIIEKARLLTYFYAFTFFRSLTFSNQNNAPLSEASVPLSIVSIRIENFLRSDLSEIENSQQFNSKSIRHGVQQPGLMAVRELLVC